MANTLVTVYDDTLEDIADAIRGKNGSSDTYKPGEMPAAITAIPTGGGVGLPREVSDGGVYQQPSEAFDFTLPSGATSLGEYSLNNAFQYNTGIRNANFNSLTHVGGANSLNYAFYNSSLRSASFPSLTTIDRSFSRTFSNCKSLASVNFGALTTISVSSAFPDAFESCTALSTVSFPLLSSMAYSSAFYFAFENCTGLRTLSFPALTSSSFGSKTDQFSNMLKGCKNVTVHFPAAIQSTIGSWSDVTNGFGGTSTTVLFDL